MIAKKKELVTYYYVMRTHSHTDRQCLWKLMSRRFKERFDAEQWMDWCIIEDQKYCRKKHEFFVISRLEEV